MGATIVDISLQEYGNPEALILIIEDNPGLMTDSVEFEMTGDLPEIELSIRAEDDKIDKKVLKELDGKKIVS